MAGEGKEKAGTEDSEHLPALSKVFSALLKLPNFTLRGHYGFCPQVTLRAEAERAKNWPSRSADPYLYELPAGCLASCLLTLLSAWISEMCTFSSSGPHMHRDCARHGSHWGCGLDKATAGHMAREDHTQPRPAH